MTEKIYNEGPLKHIKQLNKSIRYITTNPVSILIPKLDRGTLRIIGYSDASFAGNTDLSSQLGRIILLSDDSNRVVPISFKSYKSRRIARSVLAAEVIAFSDLFDEAISLRSQVEEALRSAVPLHLFTDSKSLFDIISKGSRTSEKRIMLDVHAAREGYKAKLISNIGFVRSSHNLADSLTKPNAQASLLSLLQSASHEPVVEQWIFRNFEDNEE